MLLDLLTEAHLKEPASHVAVRKDFVKVFIDTSCCDSTRSILGPPWSTIACRLLQSQPFIRDVIGYDQTFVRNKIGAFGSPVGFWWGQDLNLPPSSWKLQGDSGEGFNSSVTTPLCIGTPKC
ncbi:hypothetical protein SUGI_0758090 [Cryptomeria japonica]|nr:hypothetical protein SUGI_0758090 [Cryptomeria japonica]